MLAWRFEEVAMPEPAVLVACGWQEMALVTLAGSVWLLARPDSLCWAR